MVGGHVAQISWRSKSQVSQRYLVPKPSALQPLQRNSMGMLRRWRGCLGWVKCCKIVGFDEDGDLFSGAITLSLSLLHVYLRSWHITPNHQSQIIFYILF